ncbi:sterol carrier protein 2-like isoform X2 [Rhopilema esculentum]|uniref:sterol carrier protein 2-like isoform X2 n=1 Tax=Rhopilema esculentum TaxID=499914 RepID=UPI0031E3EDD4
MESNSVPRCFVVGVGMTRFEKPHTKKWDYPGQRAAYELGLSGVPVFNTNNNCSSASTALMMAKTFIQSKQYKCALVLGFEKMDRGLSTKYTDRVHPVDKHFDHMMSLGASEGLINNRVNKMTSDVVKLFAYAAKEHAVKFNSTPLHLAKIAYKNHCHSANNPYACLRKKFPLEMIMKSPMICDPIALLMSSPTADGSAAAVVCSEEFMIARGLQKNAVEIVAQEMVTDLPSSFGKSFIDLSGYSMAKQAARQCYSSSGLSSTDVDLLEVHDCFSCNEMLMYEALGLCDEGKGGELIDKAEWITNTEGGELCLLANRWVVNPSGGLESKGHPIGATGLAQCAEINWQLRGIAGKRQVDGARVGMQHNFGIGGAAVVTLYKKYRDTNDGSALASKL